MAVTHNALNRTKGYTQPRKAETPYSTTKRTQASTMRSRFRYQQFREIILSLLFITLRRPPRNYILLRYRIFNKALLLLPQNLLRSTIIGCPWVRQFIITAMSRNPGEI